MTLGDNNLYIRITENINFMISTFDETCIWYGSVFMKKGTIIGEKQVGECFRQSLWFMQIDINSNNSFLKGKMPSAIWSRSWENLYKEAASFALCYASPHISYVNAVIGLIAT